MHQIAPGDLFGCAAAVPDFHIVNCTSSNTVSNTVLILLQCCYSVNQYRMILSLIQMLNSHATNDTVTPAGTILWHVHSPKFVVKAKDNVSENITQDIADIGIAYKTLCIPLFSLFVIGFHHCCQVFFVHIANKADTLERPHCIATGKRGVPRLYYPACCRSWHHIQEAFCCFQSLYFIVPCHNAMS